MKQNETEIVQYSIRVPKDLNDFLQNHADRKGIAKNSLILTTLWDLKERTEQC